MKESVISLIEEKFNKDIIDINHQIKLNKSKIKDLAIKQRELKDTRKGLFEILRKLKGA